jgi:hypothetical protein
MLERAAREWYTAFEGRRRIASGGLLQVAERVKEVLDAGAPGMVLVFDDSTGRTVELDYRGTLADVRRRVLESMAPARETAGSTEPGHPVVPESPRGVGASAADGTAPADVVAPRPRGRPRLGVVAREVTLLPRHWEWLAGQPGGASVTLRRLVEQARLANVGRDRQRLAREAAYRFMTAMAGDEPGYEEAVRALFAGDSARLHRFVEAWPPDVRDHAREMSAPAFLTMVAAAPAL